MSEPLKVRHVPSVNGREPFVIGFYKKPYHMYRLGSDLASAEKVVSVTQALGVLDKSGPLVGWATRVDVAAARRMACEDWFRCTAKGCDGWLVPIHATVATERCTVRKGDDGPMCGAPMRPYRLPDAGWKLQRDIRLARIDHNHVVGDAQLRGTTVHKLHEDWVNDGKLPTLTDFPVGWRGYVRSYARFLMWASSRGLTFEVAEVLVGSKRYGFAGTCDTVAVATASDGRRARLDFKTSADCYRASHFPQLAAYELGAVECGDEPTDRQGIVLLREDGAFDSAEHIHYSTATAEDFLTTLATFKRQKPLRDADDKAYRARKKESK